MSMAGGRRSFQLDCIAVGVGHVDGGTQPFRAVALFDRSGRGAMFAQMARDGEGIERLDAQAQVIEIAPFTARALAAGAAELAVDGHQINEAAAGTQLHQAYFIMPALHAAAESLAVERQHAVKILDAQDPAGDFPNADHGSPASSSGAVFAPDHHRKRSGNQAGNDAHPKWNQNPGDSDFPAERDA